jgi:hypothetical protein
MTAHGCSAGITHLNKTMYRPRCPSLIKLSTETFQTRKASQTWRTKRLQVCEQSEAGDSHMQPLRPYTMPQWQRSACA